MIYLAEAQLTIILILMIGLVSGKLFDCEVDIPQQPLHIDDVSHI